MLVALILVLFVWQQIQWNLHIFPSISLLYFLHIRIIELVSDCTAFKLASITSLYLAVKVHNQKPFSMSSLASLSRGEYLVEDIAEMETVLLKALDWSMCPPTASCFCGHFQALLPSLGSKPSVRNTILQRSRFFSELSVMDYSLTVSLKQSEVAFAGILNSLAGLSSSLLSTEEKKEFVKSIEECTGIDHRSGNVKMAQGKLWEMYRRSVQHIIHDTKDVTPMTTSNYEISTNKTKPKTRSSACNGSHNHIFTTSSANSIRKCANE